MQSRRRRTGHTGGVAAATFASLKPQAAKKANASKASSGTSTSTHWALNSCAKAFQCATAARARPQRRSSAATKRLKMTRTITPRSGLGATTSLAPETAWLWPCSSRSSLALSASPWVSNKLRSLDSTSFVFGWLKPSTRSMPAKACRRFSSASSIFPDAASTFPRSRRPSKVSTLSSPIVRCLPSRASRANSTASNGTGLPSCVARALMAMLRFCSVRSARGWCLPKTRSMLSIVSRSSCSPFSASPRLTSSCPKFTLVLSVSTCSAPRTRRRMPSVAS
mmetsp:Transcript_49561/g.127861  ORF Transcript_49561/g.127861 Transcript_49561/m.127861 type:complete len:280 (-) Transcript_49561:1271-2110(-)